MHCLCLTEEELEMHEQNMASLAEDNGGANSLSLRESSIHSFTDRASSSKPASATYSTSTVARTSSHQIRQAPWTAPTSENRGERRRQVPPLPLASTAG